MNIQSYIGLFGLSFDVMGAWFISRGLATKSLEEMTQETGFTYGTNEAYVLSGISQKIECKFGFIFLFLGFVFQGSTYVFSSNQKLTRLEYVLYTIILALLVFIIYKISKVILDKQIQTNRTKYLHETLVEYKKTSDQMKHIEDIKRYLTLLKVKFNHDVTQEDAWKQLTSKVGLD